MGSWCSSRACSAVPCRTMRSLVPAGRDTFLAEIPALPAPLSRCGALGQQITMALMNPQMGLLQPVLAEPLA